MRSHPAPACSDDLSVHRGDNWSALGMTNNRITRPPGDGCAHRGRACLGAPPSCFSPGIPKRTNDARGGMTRNTLRPRAGLAAAAAGVHPARGACHHGGDTDSPVAAAYPDIQPTRLDRRALCHSSREYGNGPDKWVSLGRSHVRRRPLQASIPTATGSAMPRITRCLARRYLLLRLCCPV